jgi:hypothetical protein
MKRWREKQKATTPKRTPQQREANAERARLWREKRKAEGKSPRRMPDDERQAKNAAQRRNYAKRKAAKAAAANGAQPSANARGGELVKAERGRQQSLTKHSTENARAKDFVHRALAAGPRPAEEIEAEAQALAYRTSAPGGRDFRAWRHSEPHRCRQWPRACDRMVAAIGDGVSASRKKRRETFWRKLTSMLAKAY